MSIIYLFYCSVEYKSISRKEIMTSKIMVVATLLLALVMNVNSNDPPVMDPAFQVAFD